MNLWAEYNKLSYIDLRKHTQLQEVDLHHNQLIDIDIEGIPAGVIYLHNNKLERVNVKGCVNLGEFYVHNNPVKYLSLATNVALNQLDCRNTQIKSLDLSNNENMSFLFATENPNLRTIFINPLSSYSALTYDDHVTVYYRDPESYDDVNNGNWGDEDVNPWE